MHGCFGIFLAHSYSFSLPLSITAQVLILVFRREEAQRSGAMSRKSHSREVMDLISVLPQSKSPPALRPTPDRGVDAYKCQPELGVRRGPRATVGSSACGSRMKTWRCPRHFAKQTTTKTQETRFSFWRGLLPRVWRGGLAGVCWSRSWTAGIMAELRSFGGKTPHPARDHPHESHSSFPWAPVPPHRQHEGQVPVCVWSVVCLVLWAMGGT